MNNSIIEVDKIWKKYCKSLRLSLWYGGKDLLKELTFRNLESTSLRSQEFWVLNDISFSLQKGEMMGLVGVNGAGKSTLLKLLNGLIKPNRGKVTITGKVGALIELGTGFNPKLSGYENIFINGTILGLKHKEIKAKLDEIIAFSELENFIHSPIKSYSSGMMARLGFSVAVHIKPDLMLVDEILSVGDMGFREKSFNKLMEYRNDGGTIILVSHSNPVIETYCDKAILLHHGKIVESGHPSAVIAQYVTLVQKKELEKNKALHKKISDEDVLIENCFCVDAQGNYQDHFEAEEPFSIVFDYSFQSLTTVRSPDFLIAIVETETACALVNFNTRWSGLNTKAIPQSGRLICHISSPVFIKGCYDIHIGCQNKITNLAGKKWLSELRKRNSFIISVESLYKKFPGLNYSEYNRVANIGMEHSWRIESSNS